jgi:hypothetical protein
MQTLTPLIALFIPSLRGGGAERAMLLFAQELLRRGYAVDLVVTQRNGPLAEIIPVGVTLFDLNQTRTSKALPELVRYLRNRRPRALYSTIVHANVIAVMAGILARLKTPIIIRESNAPVSEPKATWSRWVTIKLVPWTYRWATGFIAVSEGVADELTAIDPHLAKTIKAIHSPVVSQELFNLAEEPLIHPWFQPGEPPFILAVARLQAHKGFGRRLPRSMSIDSFALSPQKREYLMTGKRVGRIAACVLLICIASQAYAAPFYQENFNFDSSRSTSTFDALTQTGWSASRSNSRIGVIGFLKVAAGISRNSPVFNSQPMGPDDSYPLWTKEVTELTVFTEEYPFSIASLVRVRYLQRLDGVSHTPSTGEIRDGTRLALRIRAVVPR